MASLAKITVRLVSDITEFDQGLQRAETKASAWASRVTKMGKRLTMAATLPIAGFLGYALDKASDLYESVNKVQVVFGDAADEVLRFADNSALGLGMSQQEALEAASTYGNLFESVGVMPSAAEKMSLSLVQLAADLASFNNLSPEETLAKLKSGLVGMAMPLRDVGINLSAALVQQKALDMGLAKTAKDLTPAMLMQARYALIMEQSKNAQGDFARTSIGVANSMRIVKAQLVNLAAGLGKVLLPYAMKALNIAKRGLAWLDAMSPRTKTLIVVALGLAAALGPLLWILGSFVGALSNLGGVVSGIGGLLGSSFLLPILAIAGAVALLYFAWTNDWGGIQEKAAAAWAFLQPLLAKLGNFLKNTLATAVAYFASLWTNTLSPALAAVGGYVSTVLWPVLQQMLTWSANNAAGLIGIFAAVWTGVLAPALKIVWKVLATILWPIVKTVAKFIGATFVLAVRVLAGVFQHFLLPGITKVGNWMEKHLMPIFKKVADFIGTKLQPVWDALGSSIQKIADFIGSVTSKLQALADKLANLKLPDWLTPGSPTPWEIGLWGINRALQKVASVGLPKLNDELRVTHRISAPPLGSSLTAGARAALNGNAGRPRTVTIVVPYQPTVSLADEAELERVLGPFFEEKLRLALGGAS